MPNPRQARRSRRFHNQERPISPKVTNLDNAAKKLLSIVDSGYNERQLLSEKESQIQNILNGELELSKGVSNGSIVDFITTMSKDSAKRNGQDENLIDTYSLFTEDVGNIFSYYYDLYKNRYMELSDLKFITKFIPAIGEAVKTTLDSIVSADDFSTSITRKFKFSESLTESERNLVEKELERIEREEKLLKRLRNIVYKKALVSGTTYAYVIPYAELFAEYDRLVKQGRIQDNVLVNQAIAKGQAIRGEKKTGFILNKEDKSFLKKYANESAMSEDQVQNQFGIDSLKLIDSAVESFFSTEPALPKSASKEEKDARAAFEQEFRTVLEQSFENCDAITYTDVLTDALEGFSSADQMRTNLASFKDTFGGLAVLEDDAVKTTDATVDPTKGAKPEKFSARGSYIKYVDANQLVPVQVYNQTVGYLRVHDTTAKKKAGAIQTGVMQTNIMGSTSTIFNNQSLNDMSRQKATQAVIDTITDGILANFSNKFVNKNADFKKLIADCIVANGFVNTQFQIQFIPAKYIIAFPVNEDENEMGVSILQDALFPAKMLLSLLISKLLLYMNKAGNKTIAYVRKGPIDRMGNNQIQRVVRMMQESNITFSDLLSTNLSFSKFSRYGNIQLPMAKNGDHLVDFETQEGQEVDLHTPMEEFLEKLAIMGTGVPSVILEYTDAADYAKSLVTANIKFAGRVASLQSDLEEPTTELYKKLLETSTLSDELKNRVIPGFEFKLARPRVLANMNMSDYLGQMEQLTRSISNVFLGEADTSPDAEKKRRLFAKKLGTELLPFIDWDLYDDMLKEVEIEIAKDEKLDKTGNGGEDDLGGGDEDLY